MMVWSSLFITPPITFDREYYIDISKGQTQRFFPQKLIFFQKQFVNIPHVNSVPLKNLFFPF